VQEPPRFGDGDAAVPHYHRMVARYAGG
jgi:hypothetical protein